MIENTLYCITFSILMITLRSYLYCIVLHFLYVYTSFSMCLKKLKFKLKYPTFHTLQCIVLQIFHVQKIKTDKNYTTFSYFKVQYV